MRDAIAYRTLQHANGLPPGCRYYAYAMHYGGNDMVPEQQFKLPAWLREGLEGDRTDALLNKRTDERHHYTILATLQEQTDTGWTDATSAKVFNVSTTGIGVVLRQPISLGRTVRIAPLDDPHAESDAATDDTVLGQVVYCKQTIQGFKVGCEFTAT